jgi:hypothetical protein
LWHQINCDSVNFMVIVRARRGDLRHEKSMADEAFALSPIHARASLPTDGDYDAIHEAFMETSRGRWFLTEYAKRNRNADTRMVLDAVGRLEAGLASQRQAQDEVVAAAAETAAAQAVAAQALAAEAAPRVDLWPELAKAFTRARIEIAQRLVRDSNDEAFEAIRASAETLKSISWALRERGFDARICDFLDIQVNKITDGYTGLMAESSVAGETEAEILAAFDDLIQHVEGLTSSGDAEMETLDVVVDAVADAMNEDYVADAMAAEDEEAAAAVTPADDVTAPVVEAAPMDEPTATFVEPAAPEVSATAQVVPALGTYPDAAFHEIYGDDSDIEIIDAAPIEEPPAPPARPTEPEINRQRLYEAKLGLYRASAAIAEAKAKIASSDDIEIVDVANVDVVPSAPTAIGQSHQPVAAVAAAPSNIADQAPPSPSKPSLGQALLDSGMVQNADNRSDALASFRRMSQAEKVAFFT